MSAVLITGCSSGFGEAIALAFAKRGDQVLATMRRPEAASAALKELTASRLQDVVIGSLDVTDPIARRSAIDLAVERFGRLDVLINSAGIGASGALEDMSEAQWQRVFSTNFFGPLELMKLALPVMRRQGSGRIVNITSVAALISTPLMSAYCSSKQALEAASVALDIEARSFGVRVATIVSGPFKTGITKGSLDVAPSAPYANIHAHYWGAFSKLVESAPADVSPVVNTVMTAASAADPEVRYAVGADKLMLLPNILQALAPIRNLGLHLTGQDQH